MVYVYCGCIKKSCKIDGSQMNGFDYFYTLWELNVPVKFLIVSYLSADYYYDFFRKKCVIDEDCLLNIEIIHPDKVIFKKFNDNDKILVLAAFKEDFDKLRCDTIFFICNNIVKHKKIKTYYYEYDFLLHPDLLDSENIIKYRGKIRYDILRNYKKDNKIYINSHNNPGVSLGLDNEIIREHLDGPLSLGNYNRMIYVHNPNSFDRKPRCFIECKAMNIPYSYHNIEKYESNKEIRDGSYYRYKDSIELPLESYLLTKDDEVIKMLTHD